MKIDEDKRHYLKRKLKNYLRSIIPRYNIRLTCELEDLLKIIASGISTLTIQSKIASTFLSVKNQKFLQNITDKIKSYF